MGKEAAVQKGAGDAPVEVDVSDLGPTQMNATKKEKAMTFIRRHGSLVVAVLTYALVAFVVISFDELFPLWAIQSISNHGLAFSTCRSASSLRMRCI